MRECRYILHYAPDNASIVVRLALEELALSYKLQLVDRAGQKQRAATYLALNPNGLIPVLETDQGPIFETAAILLWLADRHGGLAPEPRDADRADLLKWLFFLSNTLHPTLRGLFYPDQYVGQDDRARASFRVKSQENVVRHLGVLNTMFESPRNGLLLDLYVGPMLRWLALYPVYDDKSWFDLSRFDALYKAAAALEERACVAKVAKAEGLGDRPFTAPRIPTPPEGTPN